MAQVLIRKRPHFAETVKPEGWSDLKWQGRPLQGDVVEVRPNGYWRIEALGTGTHGWDREAFALIEVTSVGEETIAHLAGSYIDNPEAPTRLFKNRYHFTQWSKVPWIKTTVTINGVTVEEWYYIRAGFAGNATPSDKVA